MRRASGTLSGQLSTRVTLIVAALAVFLSVGTIIAAGTIYSRQLDAQLDTTQRWQQRAVGNDRHNRAPGIDVAGMPEGTIIVATLRNGTVLGSRISDGEVVPITWQAADSLLQLPADGHKHSVEIPRMGRYRAQAASTGGLTAVVALPLAPLERNLGWLAMFSLGLGALAVVAAAFVTRAIAGATTRPLRNLSRAASQVSQLSLESGEVDVGPGVEPSGLPPTHEVAQLTTAFNHMLSNVEGALAARQASETKLRRFVADASHELRNPLAAIRGYAELAERATVEGGDAAQADVSFSLGRISAESTRMTKLVNDLLLLARLDSDLPSDLRRVDLVEAVLNAVSDARAAGAGHQWQLELPTGEVDVMADQDQLHQVVVNLLSNARTHTPAGTTVTAGVGVAGGRARLFVRDNGPGIPAELLPHVFERFSRADTSRAHSTEGSTGLGLAIVHALVQRFGGSVDVTSRPGETCFTVELPLAGTAKVAEDA